MSIIGKPYTFSAGATIIAAEHNSNADTIYNDYNGNINNSNVSGSAAIAYSKLNLALSILNADINASAAIVGSKLDLSTPGNIGATSPGTGAFSTLKVGTTNQGDILYDNGTILARLTPGTSGQFLQTQGTSANPQWATASSLYINGTTYVEATAATERTSSTSTTPQKLKEISPLVRSGNLTITYDAQAPGGNNSSHERLYINDIAVGVNNTTANAVYQTFTESNIPVNAGDKIQVYGAGDGATNVVKIKNLIIKCTNPTLPVEVSGF